MPTRLSPHFSLEELTASQTAVREGIDNTPDAAARRNLARLAATLEDVRTLLGGVPIIISSGYRSPQLNRRVKGARNSAHMSGLAADFTAPAAGTVLQVARRIAAADIAFDQLIHEYGAWVHLGLAAAESPPRRETLSIFRGTGYLPGLHKAPPA
ncbi:MAG: DUF882 domain-containing protein [Burkholderiales bacterium]|nr:DUF882 domain-containing protein [Burkholderiales bacterium]